MSRKRRDGFVVLETHVRRWTGSVKMNQMSRQPPNASKNSCRLVAFLFFHCISAETYKHAQDVFQASAGKSNQKNVWFRNGTFNGQHWAAFVNFIFNSVYCHAWVCRAPKPMRLLYSWTLFCPYDVHTERIAALLRCHVGFLFFCWFSLGGGTKCVLCCCKCRGKSEFLAFPRSDKLFPTPDPNMDVNSLWKKEHIFCSSGLIYVHTSGFCLHESSWIRSCGYSTRKGRCSNIAK